MKMMKAMKKLKFWSRKKKKKKTVSFFVEPPPPCHCQHYPYYYPVEPSAPPLPISSSSSSWFDYDHPSQDYIFTNSDSIPFASSSHAQAQAPVLSSVPPDDNSAPQPSPQHPTSSASYQQYMVPDPVYGPPFVAQPLRGERGGNAFGCVFAVGAHLFRCFFPCFYIQEAKK